MQESDISLSQESIDYRAREILFDQQLDIWKKTDRLFACLLLVEWIGAIIEGLVLSPLAWTGTTSQPHIHVWMAVFWGGALVSFPVFMAWTQSGKAITRHSIAFSQMLMSALLIHLNQGRIETHFHIFASLAFLAFYRDWRVLLTASAVVALDHGLRGIFWPQSVYGVSVVQPFRFVEHTAWVVFEDIGLMTLGFQSLHEMSKSAYREAKLEATNKLLAELRDRAMEATKLKSNFVANISHELRTPLSGVLGTAELLLASDLDDEPKEMALILQDSANKLSVIVNDILDLSKIEANKLRIEYVPFNVFTLIQDSIQVLQEAANRKHLIFHSDIEERIPPVAYGDPIRIHQILINLIGNAVKFTEEGTITVRATISAEDKETVIIRIAVSDTGIGISENEQKTLFTPFTQVDDSSTRKYGGTGLGLAISKRLVSLMGGEIGIISTRGRGSTFWFTVDLKRAPEQSSGTLSVGQRALPPDLAAKWVLVVEDDKVLQQLAQKHVENMGLHVRSVASGEEALEELARRDYALILLDWQLPDIDGLTVTRRIRQLEAGTGEHKCIVALTARAMVGDREKCLAAGMDDYLSKPYTANELQNKVYRLLLSHTAALRADGTLGHAPADSLD